MREVFLVDGEPVRPLRKALMPIIRGVGLGHLMADAVRGVRAL
jgi:electron transfer flavoprotein-quinone oxidoreductase